jgi:hypothetical protein
MKKILKVKKTNSHKTNLEKVRARYAEMGGDNKWFKPKPNTTTVVRIMPPWGESADGSFFLTGGLHYGFSIGGRDRAIACKRISGKGECPVCALVGALRNSGDEEHKELGDRLRVRPKYWVNLIVRPKKEGETPDEKVYMFGGNKKFIDALMSAMEDSDFGDITDPEEGHDVKIKRTGAGMNDTRYEYMVRPRSTSIGLEDWESKLPDLSTEVLEFMPYDEMVGHLKKNFGELLAELGLKFKGVKEDAKKLKTKKKPIQEEDEEDEDEEEEDKDEDDEDDD